MTTRGRLPSRRIRSAALTDCSGVWQRIQSSFEQSREEKEPGSKVSRPSIKANSGRAELGSSCSTNEATTRARPDAGWAGTISVMPPRGKVAGFRRSKSERDRPGREQGHGGPTGTFPEGGAGGLQGSRSASLEDSGTPIMSVQENIFHVPKFRPRQTILSDSSAVDFWQNH